MDKFLVVDGNSILNRAFYGVKGLTTASGMPTNAVFGMINILHKHLRSVEPTHAIIAFDMRAKTFRHKMYDGYKANRTGMPDDLAVQMPYAKECAKALGFHIAEQEGYEADDILGTVSRQFSCPSCHTYLLTGDRDSLQLINPNTTVLLATNKDTVPYDEKAFIAEYGVTPDEFIDVKALMGDSSDNIPGVAGIGSKTALKLISEFHSLDGVYNGLAQAKLSSSVKQKLSDGRENAYLSQKLATICCEVPLDNEPSAYIYEGISCQDFRALCEKLEFSGMIKRFGLDEAVMETACSCGEEAEDTIKTYDVIPTTVGQLSEHISGDEISLTIEHDKALIYDGATLCSLSDVDDSTFETLLDRYRVVIHDAKLLYKRLIYAEKNCSPVAFDTMLGAYVLNSSVNSFSLSDCYLRLLGKTLMEGYPKAVAVWELYGVMKEEIAKIQAEHLLYDMELPFARVLAEMECIGFHVDTAGIAAYGELLSKHADSLAERIYALAGEVFNIQSPKQLGEVLFEKLGLPSGKKTKTGYSTNAEVLNKLIGKHPIIEDILEYRQVTKLRSTYAEGLLKMADANGVIHTVFNQTGTATGRISSAEPNLQNIPVKTELGREFRKFFVPSSPDRMIVDADYSQIELRLLAAISGDENMIDAFANGEDIHTNTASRVFSVPADEVTPELRKRAKAVNFGIVYGIGEYSLSQDIGTSVKEAKQYIESYKAGYPKIEAYLSSVKTEARQNGYVSTLMGRRRYIPELTSSNKMLQHFGERVAMNSPIQGTAADIIKLAMIRVRDRLLREKLDAKLILQVHDELLLDVSSACTERAMLVLREEMEHAVQLSVPLSVEAKAGRNWFLAK